MDQQPSVAIAVAPIRPDSIAWSENNKIAIVAPSSIHILTPSITRKKDKSCRVIRHTVLASEKQPESRRYDAVGNTDGPFMTAFAVYNGFKSAVWSPLGSLVPGSCTLTVVTISHHVHLYHSKCGIDKEKWELLRDLTPMLGIPSDLTSHVLCASWSKSIASDPNHSAILALGSKQGHVSFWCNQLNNESISKHKVIEDSDAWLTVVEWSHWYNKEGGWVAYLMAGFSNGELSIVKVTVAQQTITAVTVQSWFEDDTRAPTVIKVISSGSEFKVAVAKSSSVHIATFEHDSGNNLVHVGNKWYSIVLPIATHFTGKYRISSLTTLCARTNKKETGMVWAQNGTRLHIFAGEYANFSLTIQDESLIIDKQLAEMIHARTSQAIRAQAVLNAKKTKLESKQSESYRALVWGATPSPNGLYYSLSYTLVPVSDRELGDVGFDSYCAWIRDAQDPAQVEPALSTTINNWLIDGSEQGNTEVFDIIDYIASNGDEQGIVRLMENLKAKCDAYGEDTQPQTSNDQLEHLLNANPRNNAFKLLYYINEHIQALEISKAVLEKAKELASNSKLAMSWFYTRIMLRMLLRSSDEDWNTLDATALSQILILADSVLIWHPFTELTIPLVTELYQRVQTLRPGATARELQMLSDLQDGTRAVIEPSDLTPREPCPSCQQLIPLVSNTYGICPSNHFWERCQLTRAVLDTPRVRSCRVCRCKIKQASQGPFQIILGACSTCIYCGSTF